jgi:hypothetical protein
MQKHQVEDKELKYTIEYSGPTDVVSTDTTDKLIEAIIKAAGTLLSGAGLLDRPDSQKEYLLRVAKLMSEATSISTGVLTHLKTREVLDVHPKGDLSATAIFGAELDD